MNSTQPNARSRARLSRLGTGGAFLAALGLAAAGKAAPITSYQLSQWGAITAPVFGSSEGGAYAGAELFAGPNKLGGYFRGVLPNGRLVTPAGTSTQIGMNPLGARLTPDGKFLITTNDDERDGGIKSLQNPANVGGYSLSVIRTSTMQVASQINSGPVFVGLQITGSGPYTVWASGGPSNSIKLYSIDANGQISAGSPASIAISPTLPQNQGYVSNYTPSAAFNTADGQGNKPSVPTGFSRTGSTKITFPAGSQLSPDGRFLYVACNGDNSVAVIDTTSKSVVRQLPVGYFPYDVSVNSDGTRIAVTNWGIGAYQFKSPTYDANGILTSLTPTGPNEPDGYYVPLTDPSGPTPKSSSVSFLNSPSGNGAAAAIVGGAYLGHPLDALRNVGDTHPSATAMTSLGALDIVYVARTNSDSLSVLVLNRATSSYLRTTDVDLSPFGMLAADGHPIHGSYPNALAVSPDRTRLFVAEAGLNSVAVLDIRNPLAPQLRGRIPTGWYPTGLTVSPDGNTLYVVNAKGVGEDINPNTQDGGQNPTGVESFTDGNFIFGTAQKIDLRSLRLDNTTVLANNFSVHFPAADDPVVPLGGHPSRKIKHVFFILHENKTFDSMLGNQDHFGPFAATKFNKADGSLVTDPQFTPVSLNTQTLATTFATAVNYYSDSEESDAGHQFCASGTASDYTEKTLLVKSGRGLLVNKNFEPEDYPESGYIFNNAARNGVSFKDYGAMIRIDGTDTGASAPTVLNDPLSGAMGYPVNPSPTNPHNVGDVDTPTQGLGQSYFLSLPILSILGTQNPNGEARLDHNYPGYSFNISDQRRAKEFIQDFDRMVANNTLPQFVYIYQPSDHTGGTQANNVAAPTAAQQVGDGDVALGMVVQHIMKSPAYYNADTGDGSAIFITYDDAQSTLDHIHEHRTPLIVASPYAKPAYIGKRHYSTASVVKTEELLLGLPPNNLGDLLATDLRDFFQPQYNGITADQLTFNRVASYRPTKEGRRLWSLVKHLDTSAPDRDSHRLGALARLSLQADRLHRNAEKEHQLHGRDYRHRQEALYAAGLKLVAMGKPARDADD